MNKRSIVLAIAGLISLAAAPLSPAGLRPPVGTARTTLSLFSVEGSLDGTSQSVGLTVGSGLATTDPAENPPFGFNRAAVEVALAELAGEGPAAINERLTISAEAEGPGSRSQNDAELSETFDYGDALTGSLVVGARSAEVDEDLASASLGQVLLSAQVLNGLVRLEGVTIVGVAAESNTTTAVANQGVTIDEVSIFSLTQLFDQLGTSVSELSVESLMDFADDILGPGTSQPLRDALQDVTDAEQTVAAADEAVTAAGQALTDASQAVAAAEAEAQSALGETEETSNDAAALDGAVAELSDGGIPCLTESCDEDAIAIATVLSLAEKYGVAAAGDPLTVAAATSVAIAAAHDQAQSRLAAAQAALAAEQAAEDAAEAALADAEAAQVAARDALDAALAAVQPAREALEGTIADQSLLTLRNVVVEVSAQAFDTDASSSARITFGSADVVGREIAVDDLVAAAAALEAEVDDVMASITEALEEAGLLVTADLDFPTSSFSSGTDSGYQVAGSELSVFGITVSAAPSGQGLSVGSSAPEVMLRASVLSLTANASHLAGQESLPGPDDDPLPDTGDDTQASQTNTQVQGGSQNSSDDSGNASGSDNAQNGSGSGPGSGGGPGSNPQSPGGGPPTLPKTGIDSGRFLLLASQLILLGWALERRSQRPSAGGS